MNNLTVSLETAKKLKEAGWNERTVFSYSQKINSDKGYTVLGDYRLVLTRDVGYAKNDSSTSIYAPTLSELLAEMPKELEDRGESKDWSTFLIIDFCGNIICYENEWREFEYAFGDEEQLLESASDLWLKLKSENLIK